MKRKLIIILLSCIYFNIYSAADLSEEQLAENHIQLNPVESLINAIKSRDISAVRILLDANINVNTLVTGKLDNRGVRLESNIGWRPLHLAAHLGNKDIAELLLNKGADPNLSVDFGNTESTALYYAVISGDIEMVRLLINYGANVNFERFAGDTLLHLACRRNFKEIPKLLIDAGANVNAKSHPQDTPLWNAAFFCSKDVIYLLLDAGADTSIRGGSHCELPGKITRVHHYGFEDRQEKERDRLQIIEMINNYVTMKPR